MFTPLKTIKNDQMNQTKGKLILFEEKYYIQEKVSLEILNGILLRHFLLAGKLH